MPLVSRGFASRPAQNLAHENITYSRGLGATDVPPPPLNHPLKIPRRQFKPRTGPCVYRCPSWNGSTSGWLPKLHRLVYDRPSRWLTTALTMADASIVISKTALVGQV